MIYFKDLKMWTSSSKLIQIKLNDKWDCDDDELKNWIELLNIDKIWEEKWENNHEKKNHNHNQYKKIKKVESKIKNQESLLKS